MTPENKEKIRLNLIDYITGTVDEWLRLAHFDQTPEDHDGIQYRINWEHPTDGAMIANVCELTGVDPIAQFGVQIVVDALPDLPPIGAENDPALIEELEVDPVWVETAMGNALINDEIRMGSEQATVVRSNRGIWNVSSKRDGYKTKNVARVISRDPLMTEGEWVPDYVEGASPWFPADRHVELRLELQGPTAPAGFQQYPAAAAVEILCTPERLAVLRIQEGFPGSAPISSDVH